MTIKQLEYVMAVVKYGSLSQAAANLYISQPTLSEGLQNLEDELGFPLFLRRHSGMVLTPEGTTFVTDAQTVLEQIGYMAQRYSGRMERRLRFSVSSTHFYCVESAFAKLSNEIDSRQYTLRLLDSRKLDVFQEVASGVSELGVASYTDENYTYTIRKLKSMDLEYQVACTLQPTAFLSEKHPLARKNSLRTEELRSYPCITFYQGPSTPRYFEEEMIILPEWEKELMIQDNGAATIFLLETDGFSIGSGIIPSGLRDIGLCTVPISDAPPCTVIWVKRKNHVLSEVAKRFMTLCEAELFSGKADKKG